MTEDEARKLATRFIDTWPTGPRAYIWRDILISLDVGYAARAYRGVLRDIEKGIPTPGQYLAAYRALQRADHPPSTEPAPDNTQTISRPEYLAALTQRAHLDPAAAAELEHWRRLQQRQMLV